MLHSSPVQLPRTTSELPKRLSDVRVCGFAHQKSGCKVAQCILRAPIEQTAKFAQSSVPIVPIRMTRASVSALFCGAWRKKKKTCFAVGLKSAKRSGSPTMGSGPGGRRSSNSRANGTQEWLCNEPNSQLQTRRYQVDKAARTSVSRRRKLHDLSTLCTKSEREKKKNACNQCTYRHPRFHTQNWVH